MIEGELIANHKSQTNGKFFKRLDSHCKMCKQLVHEVVICIRKFQKDETIVQVTINKEEEYHFFLASYFFNQKL